jgi:hypothetical protein
MNLRPDLSKPLLVAWAVFGGVLLLCGGIIWWLADDGDLPTRVTSAEAEMRRLSGPVDLAKRIVAQEQANQTLVATIERLKADTGLTVAAPFLVPANHPQPGQYFNEQLAAVQDFCRPKAQGRSIAYQERLGFENTAKVPRDEDAPYLLTMLQLTRKAADIVLSTPTPVQSFRISQPLKQAVLTGPVGRPPLLKELPLRLDVRGSLADLLWILHHLAQREQQGDYPLIVRSWRIDSKNINPDDGIQQLDAVFEVAAMQFLTKDEREAAAKAGPRRSTNNL